MNSGDPSRYDGPVPVPGPRLIRANERPARPEGRYLLYWMTAARRLDRNFALQHAVDLALEFGRPLVVFEGLRCGYPHASERLHAFVLQGMAEHARVLRDGAATYFPYVERRAGEGSGLLRALARDAVAIVTDWYPAFFLPAMLASAARQVDVRLDAVDGNGLLPVLDAGRAIPTAYAFRARVQRTLKTHLSQWPEKAPLDRLPTAPGVELRADVHQRWPAADLSGLEDLVRGLPIDHAVRAVNIAGGSAAARARLRRFVDHGLEDYAEAHNQPEQDATSRLSPWLHFGHLSVHEVFEAVMSHEKWTSRKLGAGSRGAREGWWNVSPSAEAFLDELITWRELAFNTCAFVPGYDTFGSLPEWARRTLDAHRTDPREHVYSYDEFDRAATHDPLWNAVQRQLVRDGWFHGYMRMLWGKKIFEWSKSPEAALDVMARLMNRYALDGRDPNSWAGFAWVLGRYDRPWPERDVYGTVRYMSSGNTARKLKVKQYLAKYGPAPATGLFDRQG